MALTRLIADGRIHPGRIEETVAKCRAEIEVVMRQAGEQAAPCPLPRLFRQMATAFPDALVTGWEPLAETVQLPDPDDRHVVAAARAGRADVIVTDNLADFPPAALPAPLVRQSMDDFLLDTLDLRPGPVIAAVRAVAGRTGRSGPAMTARDIAAYL